MIRLSPDQPKPKDGKPSVSLLACAMLTCAGGTLDAFTYLGHGHVFATSMTGNVVLLGLNAVRADWPQTLLHFVPIAGFCLGVSTAEGITRRSVWKNRASSSAWVLSVEIAILALVGCLPRSAPDSPITICVAFAAALQAATFRTVEGYSYNATFTTGNLRSLSESFFDWIAQKCTPAAPHAVRVFAAVCGSFLLGTLVGALLTPILGNKMLWVTCSMLTMVRLRFLLKDEVQ